MGVVVYRNEPLNCDLISSPEASAAVVHKTELIENLDSSSSIALLLGFSFVCLAIMAMMILLILQFLKSRDCKGIRWSSKTEDTIPFQNFSTSFKMNELVIYTPGWYSDLIIYSFVFYSIWTVANRTAANCKCTDAGEQQRLETGRWLRYFNQMRILITESIKRLEKSWFLSCCSKPCVWLHLSFQAKRNLCILYYQFIDFLLIWNLF